MLFEKFREAALAIVPLTGVVVALYYVLEPFGVGELRQWFVGCGFLVIGLSFFMVGAQVGLVPFGQAVGAALPHSRNMILVLLIAFILGVAAAYAEPDLHFMSGSLRAVAQQTTSILFTEGTAFAIGLFSLVGVARILFKIPLKRILGPGYAAVLLYGCFFVDKELLGAAFANGGGATGPMVASLLMALGIGVTSTAKVSSGNSASFGLVGLLSLGGVVLALLALSGANDVTPETLVPPVLYTADLLPYYLDLTLVHAKITVFMMVPLTGLFVAFQLLFLKLPGIKASRMGLGMFYTALGIICIMTGLMGGIMPGGYALGKALGALGSGFAVVAVCALLGVVTVLLEPAVWVWAAQVADALGGSMKRLVLVGILCLSGGVGVVLGLLPVLYGTGLWWILPAGYVAALALMFCTPRLATGIAFDAGGVITGPLSLFFFLAAIVGAVETVKGSAGVEVYSLIAFIALVPLITIQLLGILFMRKEGQRLAPAQQKRMGVGV